MEATGGSSASAIQYDVFLSFRGSDTRNTFTDCLYRTMVGQGIVAYRDSEQLHAGDRIDDLLRAVGESKICIPVLSSGYASSAWCLRELARVTDKHGEVIDLVVKAVLRKLKAKQRPLDSKLVGVDEQVEAIMESLDVDSGTGVRFVGIYGMGRIGKTTLAKIVFNALCPHFSSQCSFIENIRESSIRIGLEGVQKQLASGISDSRFVQDFSNTDEGIDSIKRRAGSKKVLIVLDDLDKKEQLKKLVGGRDTFGSGSRIIIITRNKTILDEEEGILPYEVTQMNCDKALELFSLHAFKSASPPNTHQSLSREVVSTSGGLPLALEVTGSSLRGKEIKIWKAMLKKLKKVPHEDVRDKLKISYDALENEEKEIFLDIACFFMVCKPRATYFWDACKSRATYFWDACDLFPDIALEKLTNLCLIKIVDGSAIRMHDQLIDLGRYIVCQECDTNLIGCNRLWNEKEALEVVRSKERKDKLRALNLSGYRSDPVNIVDEELERMPNLKFLKLRAGTFVGDINNHLPELRWLSWYSLLCCAMADFHLENLAVLELFDVSFGENWGGWNILKMANKLKDLSLSKCSGLKRTPDFSGCPSLERLSLSEIHILQEVDSSIGKLKGLTHLNIFHCVCLRNLPEEIGGLVNMKHFCISSCRKMEKLPYSIWKLTSLYELRISCAKLTSLPDSIDNAKHLSSLDQSGKLVVELLISIGNLTQLEFLSLYLCERLRKLPESIDNLKSLQNLDLSWTSIVELPDSIENLKRLKVLNIRGSAIRRLPASIGMLERLEELDAYHCEQLDGELPIEIGKLLGLSILDLSYTHVRAMPTTIDSLTRLQKLDLTGCNELQELPELPSSLNCLRVQSTSLRSVPDLSNLTNLVELHLSNGFERVHAQASNPMQTLQLQSVGKLSELKKLSWGLLEVPLPLAELGCYPRLREVTFSGMDSFNSVVVGPKLSNLKYLSKLCLYRSPLGEIQLDGLELSKDLDVKACEFLGGLSIISSSMRNLCRMIVWNCPKLLDIRFLCTMESLEELRVESCNSLGELYGLSNSKKLMALRIQSCDGLRVVEGLEELKLLNRLVVFHCGSLERLIDVSKLEIPNECWIRVWNCEKLPCTNDDFISYGEYREMIHERTRKTFNEEDEIKKVSGPYQKKIKKVSEDSMKENDTIDCPDLEDSMKDNDSKPSRFFQGRSLRRKTG